jgi:hypothetical protein
VVTENTENTEKVFICQLSANFHGLPNFAFTEN